MYLKFSIAAVTCAAVLSVASLPSANATPYAYASNTITGLKVTNADGSLLTASTATTSISNSAQFDGNPISGFQARSNTANGVTIQQAYSGPSATPAATYSPQTPGTFVGSRADATISAGWNTSAGVNVQNLAEGYGNALGNSNATNNAAISFTVTGTGQALRVSFSDVYQLIASTATLVNESANASIQTAFSITSGDSSTPLFSFAPGAINRQISSVAGTPSVTNVGLLTFLADTLTPILTMGTSYNISLTSTATQTIQPGTAVPEPASMALLGASMIIFGMVRHRSMRG